MDTILSFGAGLQTTALAILLSEKKLEVDAVVFADTGCEKPETYRYMNDYTKPLLSAANIPFYEVRTTIPSEKGNLYDFLWSTKDLPSVRYRECTKHFKIGPIHKLVGKHCIQLIGFALDESFRAERARDKEHRRFPLIELGMRSTDCRKVISDYGWPIPLKSSCYICVFQTYVEWNWLKSNHPDLFERALALEENFYSRKPLMRDRYGLLRGTGLWRIKNGLQPEMLVPGEYSCWEGYCSH